LEYLRTIHERYQRASKEEKHRMLNEFCKVSRYHRGKAASGRSAVPGT
jgi:hypothetical protein